ncbi:MAG: ATP-binding protein [Planctomycetota bacterium]
MTYQHRSIEPHLRELARAFPAILVTGPRQTGKTSLLTAVGAAVADQSVTALSFDTPQQVDRFRRDPELFFQEHPGVLFLDEVQHAPDVFPWLKREIDRTGKGFRFFLSGSQHFHLMRGVTESLAGRVAVLDLWPFAARELDTGDLRPLVAALEQPERLLELQRVDYPCPPDRVLRAMLRGGYPPVCLDQAPATAWFESYRRTFVQRDIRDLSQVADLGRFDRFVTLCAGRSGTVVNKSEIANSLGIDNKTVDHWLSLLESSYQVVSLPAYHQNTTSRLTKRPKLLFADSGLGLHLQAIREPDTLRNAPHFGRLFEAFVLMEIRKLFGHAALPWNGHHWSTPRGAECDLVLPVGERLIPVEVKFAASVGLDDARGIDAMRRIHGERVGTGIVVSLSPRLERIAERVINLPVGMLLGG